MIWLAALAGVAVVPVVVVWACMCSAAAADRRMEAFEADRKPLQVEP